MVELLEIFLLVAETGSLRRSAEALSITQPTASWRIHQLEALLGQVLFVRTSRGMVLTDAGKALLPYAERAVRAVEEVEVAMAAFRRGEIGRIVIGTIPSVCTYLLPKLLKRFHDACPGVEVVVKTGQSEEILRAVVEMEVHLGFVRDVSHPDVLAELVSRDEVILAVRPDHPFAGLPTVSIEAIGREGLILFERASVFSRMTQDLFDAAGIVPHIRMELDSAESAKMMVLEGIGVALLPSMAVADELRSGRLVRVHVAGAPPIYRQILLIRRKDDVMNEAKERFYAIVDEGGQAAP